VKFTGFVGGIIDGRKLNTKLLLQKLSEEDRHTDVILCTSYLSFLIK